MSATFGGIAPAQILLEASTESEWVAAYLEQLGHAKMTCFAGRSVLR